jgi:hypothetical protein
VPAKLTPAERLARIAETSPRVTDLARALSLCVRAEPELVRRLRLTVAPRSGAWIEADLYFSALVAQRTPDWLVLAPEFAAELREDLVRRMRSGAEERRRIGAIRRAIKHAHAAAPFEIRLEEDVIWLAVERRGGARRARLAINQTLRQMFARFLQSTEQSLVTARWFAAAARRLPSIARETEGFALLAFASSVALGGPAINPGLKATHESFEQLSRYLPDSVKRWPLWVGLTTRGVHFSFTPIQGHQEIAAPRTDPVLLEVRANNGRPQLAHVAQGQAAFVELEGKGVEIRTLSRDVFRLREVGRKEGTLEGSTSADFSRVEFDYDVYVSYSHLDSEWVGEFTRRLQTRLEQRAGRKVRIYRDTMLTGGDRFDDQMTRAVRSSALLLAVVTPSYLNSEFTRQELGWFEAAANEQTGGTIVESRSRAIPVMPIPVNRKELPPVLEKVLGYEFFERRPESNELPQFDSDSPQYLGRIDRVAQDIAGMLRRREERSDNVYIEATQSAEIYLKRLQEDLAQRHITWTSEVRGLGQRPRLAVLLIGDSAGYSGQLVQAMKERPELRLLVWVSPSLEEPGELTADLERYPGVEIVAGRNFELFVQFIVEALQASRSRTASKGEAISTVNFSFDASYSEDQSAAQMVAARFRELGFQVLMPATDISNPREHRRLLVESDAVLIYWGAGNEARIADLFEEAVRLRKPVVVYAGPPGTPDKRAFAEAWREHDVGGPNLTIVHSEDSPESGIDDAVRAFRGKRPPAATT